MSLTPPMAKAKNEFFRRLQMGKPIITVFEGYRFKSSSWYVEITNEHLFGGIHQVQIDHTQRPTPRITFILRPYFQETLNPFIFINSFETPTGFAVPSGFVVFERALHEYTVERKIADLKHLTPQYLEEIFGLPKKSPENLSYIQISRICRKHKQYEKYIFHQLNIPMPIQYRNIMMRQKPMTLFIWPLKNNTNQFLHVL